jgi:hypothetical protein
MQKSGLAHDVKSGTVYITHNQDCFLFYLTWTQYVSAAIVAVVVLIHMGDPFLPKRK